MDTAKTSTINSLYRERTTLYTFITPYNANLNKEQYFQVSYKDHSLGFIITDIDFISTENIMYVSIDPSYIRTGDDQKIDITQVPKEELDENYFWLNGGK